MATVPNLDLIKVNDLTASQRAELSMQTRILIQRLAEAERRAAADVAPEVPFKEVQ